MAMTIGDANAVQRLLAHIAEQGKPLDGDLVWEAGTLANRSQAILQAGMTATQFNQRLAAAAMRRALGLGEVPA